MKEQKPLFDLDDIPPVKNRAKKKIYAVYRIQNDEKRYIWKSNDGIEWISETELAANTRKKPMLLSLSGVRWRMKELATSYRLNLDNVGFEIWERD